MLQDPSWNYKKSQKLMDEQIFGSSGWFVHFLRTKTLLWNVLFISYQFPKSDVWEVLKEDTFVLAEG